MTIISKMINITGACEGTLACSTCHVILNQEDYDRLPDEPCDEELDMLDLAYGLTNTLVPIMFILSSGLDILFPPGPETIGV